MKLLTRNEARLANQMLIHLQRQTALPPADITQQWLFASIRARDPYVKPEDLVPVLAKLVEWDVIHRAPPENYDPMMVWDYKYNLATSFALATWGGHITLFADISPQENMVGPYEVLVYRRDWFNDGAKWEASVLKIHREAVNYEFAAAIIVRAVRQVYLYSPLAKKTGTFTISVEDIVNAVQYDLCSIYPMLSPLYVQAWFEHPFVATCVDFANKLLARGDGHPNARYVIGGVSKVPTLDEVKEALTTSTHEYPFHSIDHP